MDATNKAVPDDDQALKLLNEIALMWHDDRIAAGWEPDLSDQFEALMGRVEAFLWSAARAATATVAKDGGEVVGYLAEDDDGNVALERTERHALRRCEPGARVTPVVRATHQPEASAEQSAGEVEPYAFLVTLHDGRVMNTYFDRDGAEYWGKSYGNPSKIVPLYLAAPISEQPAGLAHLAHENNGEGCVSFASPTGESLSARDAEEYLRAKYGAYRGHFAWRELEAAFNAGRALKTVPGEPT